MADSKTIIELAKKNNLSWPYTLKIGQTLIIP